MKGLTKHVTEKDDMVVHVEGEHDYRFKSFDRELIFRHVLDAFKAETGKDLSVFGVRGKMETYMTSQDDYARNQVKGLPPGEYEIFGTDAANE